MRNGEGFDALLQQGWIQAAAFIAQQQGVKALTIPHQAAVESLNVAVAAGVLLLERVRQGHDRRESAATALGA